MKIITVNDERCTRCGICTEICPVGIPKLGENGPETVFASMCMACGQCVAVCPCAALDHDQAPLDRQEELNGWQRPGAKDAEYFLRSRRSVRAFTAERVPRQQLQQLLHIARFAPTGRNSQGLSYRVVEDPGKMAAIAQTVFDWLQAQARSTDWVRGYARLALAFKKKGEDFILRHAPHLIVATAPSDFVLGHDNSRFALAYVELYAPSLGLGTCWAGVVEMCAAAPDSPLRPLLGIPADQSVVAALMAGYPRHSYHRLVDREPLRVEWI